jgi:MFS family permease
VADVAREEELADPQSRRSFFGDLRAVLAERDFRRLFATRLVSQTGDGVLTAGVGTYVFFNATTYTSPAAGAAAFAVLYLPYSVIGPFAGVFIDRWSRRQILVWSAALRSVFVLLTAGLMAANNHGVALYIAVLLVLGVNRFFLSSLSAALPHVVAGDKLVMANSVSPTAGGIMGAIGGIVAAGLNAATGDTERGAAITLLVAGGCYVAASMVATTMHKDLLGPIRGQAHRIPLSRELVVVAAGLAQGARYVARRRGPLAALGATGGYSFLFGPMFLMSILLYRNYFYASDVTTAEGHYVVLAAVSAVGYGCAAFITPPATHRLTKPSWITLMLLASGVVTLVLGETFNAYAYLAIGFLIYLCRQSVAICSTTILQEEVEDAYRGRVFAFYDMMYNVTYVAGAAISAAFLPVTGKSPGIVLALTIGFLLVAAGYWASGGRRGGGGIEMPSPAAQRSSS